MSNPTFTPGYTWASGATVMPIRLNSAITGAILTTTQTDVLIGRETTAGGPAEEIACTAAGRAVLAAATAADQRTALGVGSLGTQAANAAAVTGGVLAADTYAANNEALAYGATVTLNFATTVKTTQTITLTGDLTLATSNLASGRTKFIRLIGDSTARTLTFPAGWKFLNGTAPAALAGGKVGMLFLFSWGTTAADVTATYAVEP
jgi:hypothetical protein